MKISVTPDARVKKYGKRARARARVYVHTHLARTRKYPRYGCNNDRDVTSDKCTREHAFFRDVYGDRCDLTNKRGGVVPYTANRQLMQKRSPESILRSRMRYERRLRWRRCTGKWLIKIIIKRLDMQIDTRINARMFLIRYLNLWLHDARRSAWDYVNNECKDRTIYNGNV